MLILSFWGRRNGGIGSVDNPKAGGGGGGGGGWWVWIIEVWIIKERLYYIL